MKNHILCRLEGDCVHLESKQDKEGHKEDKIVVRSVKGNHKTESHLRNGLLKMKELCVGVECLKLSSIPYVGYECRYCIGFSNLQYILFVTKWTD